MNKKNTTKTQIKQAAIRQIEKFGIDKTSMRSIAAEANMTTGAIYYYYKNKQDLFDEIVTDSIHFAHRIFHENENEKITVDSLFSDVEKEARIRFKRLQEEKTILTSIIRCNEMRFRIFPEIYLRIEVDPGSGCYAFCFCICTWWS